MANAGLECSNDIAGCVSFESPGLPAHLQQPACLEKFVQYNTFPNYVTLMHPAVNTELRFHIPVYEQFAANTWPFVQQCLVADANRVLNWGLLCSFTIQVAASMRCIHSGGKLVQAASAISGASRCSNSVKALHMLGKHYSARLTWDDFRHTHAMDGIVKHLSYGAAVKGIRPILKWPSDHGQSNADSPILEHIGKHVGNFLQNELLFNQPHLPGCHHLNDPDGMRRMHEARMKRLWASQWELGPPLASVLLEEGACDHDHTQLLSLASS